MSNSPFEVPSEMRDFASRSVEQARKAFETFIGAAQKASDSMGTTEHPLQQNLVEASRMTVGYAEKNMNAAFDMAQKLVQAKTVEDAFKIQTEFMQTQAQALQAQMQEAGQKVKAHMEGAAEQMQSSVAKVTKMATDNMNKAGDSGAAKPAAKPKA